mmetsp:Transcript_109177/g.189173  ORF Transcript_109177/g.189173 Transcript_109177/m.189173 type:complete len:552 (-) Transcript_109177:490-2145(-)
MVTRINLWSGPRCASTALMYSFKSRGDCAVLDEPFYAWYLKQYPDMYRPYRDELLKSMETNYRAVIRDSVLGPTEAKLGFYKHIASMAPPDMDWARKCRNVILFRNPADSLMSYTRVIGTQDVLKYGAAHVLGLKQQVRILQELRPEQDVLVVSNASLLQRPEGTLQAICQGLGITFTSKMLKWKKGGIPEDGLWAKYWYHSSHATTSFDNEAQAKPVAVPDELRPALDECMPYYETLLQHALQPLPVLLDERNAHLQVYVGGRIVPREEAKVSVFDSSVQAGDAVWEGLRVKNGKIFALHEHLDRLFASAKALLFERVPARDVVVRAVMDTLQANGMRDGALCRLTLTRGEKVTSGMSPRNNQSGPCLIVLAEWKGEHSSVANKAAGLRLITSAIRRNTPSCLDSKIHHNNIINNILAKIQADQAGADDALMLDLEGFASETNAMNFFIVRGGVVLTPFADSCLPGITRRMVIEKVTQMAGVTCKEARLSLTDVWTADEAFTTGTMGGISPVVEIDGRLMAAGPGAGPITRRLQEAYIDLQERDGVPLTF